MTDLKNIFAKQADYGLYRYKHPHEDNLIKAARDRLSQCPMGKNQLKIVDMQKITLKVIKGNDQRKFVPGGDAVYIIAPSAMTKPNAEFILDLSGGIREAEQFLLGYALPDKDKDPENHGLIYHTRQVDLFTHLFKLVDDFRKNLNENESQKYLNVINVYGYNELYNLYKSGVSHDDLVAKYISYVVT